MKNVIFLILAFTIPISCFAQNDANIKIFNIDIVEDVYFFCEIEEIPGLVQGKYILHYRLKDTENQFDLRATYRPNGYREHTRSLLTFSVFPILIDNGIVPLDGCSETGWSYFNSDDLATLKESFPKEVSISKKLVKCYDSGI